MQYFISSSVLIEILIILNNNFHHVFPHQTTNIYSRSLVKTVCLLCKHTFQTSPLSQLSKLPFSDSFYTEIDCQYSYLTVILLIWKEYVLELVHEPIYYRDWG